MTASGSVSTPGTPIGVKIDDLSHSFGTTRALENVRCEIRPGTITGIVGRNGAGKTTLVLLIASLRKVQTGSLLVDGKSPWEDQAITSRVCLMREKGGIIEDEKVRNTLKIVSALRPNWDQGYAGELMDLFEIPYNKKPEHLSRGKRSALSAVIALASRCELTILDEVYLGMDAVARRLFYDAIMSDYVAHPRTIVISSHLLDEVEDLMEDVIILDRGRVIAMGDADTVRQSYSGSEAIASLTDVLLAISSPRKSGEE